jgi:DNA-binding response OmpR family regulator
VEVVANGQEALKKALDGGYDAAVMDVMLPGLDGLSAIEQLRAKHIAMPVLILSARHTVDDRVRGLQAGGDDYLTKPFAFAELLARLQALLRRAGGAAEPTRLAVGDLTLDLLSRKVQRAGRAIELRPREFALLEYLMRHPGRVLSKTMILSHVWGYSFDPGTNVVDVLVSRLRDQVDEGFERRMIHTVRGAGYVLKVD